jgi:hypothetical protein
MREARELAARSWHSLALIGTGWQWLALAPRVESHPRLSD